MNVFISHQSALEYWRTCLALPPAGASRRYRGALPGNPPTNEQVRLSELKLPLHIILGKAGTRWASTIMKQHVFTGKAPEGSFIRIDNKFFVSSPEFCFLQMANVLPLAGLIRLGYELCGTYSKPAPGTSNVPERGFHNREPLTSKKKIEAFVNRMPGFKGRLSALRALRYILDGSASPMETNLAMFLTLPYMLGGFGFDQPELNKRITLSKNARKYFDKSYYVCDLFWENEQIAVEYDSDQHHTGSERIASDSNRRNALGLAGIRVVSITKHQLYSSLELEGAARTIAGHMQKRLFSKKSNFYERHYELRRQLLDVD